MESKEILQRLFYIDQRFFIYTKNEFSWKNFSLEKLERELDKIKGDCENLSIDVIRKILLSINDNNAYWFDRYENLYCKIIRVDPNKLCIDDYHRNLDGFRTRRGEMLKDFLIKFGNYEDVIIRNDKVDKVFDLLEKRIPIVIRKYGELFEVMSGNHRGMVALKRGREEIRALLICDKTDPNREETLSSIFYPKVF